MTKYEKYYEEILKPMNSCSYTGVESMVAMEVIGDYAVLCYKDRIGNLRANVVVDGNPVCGILTDHTGEISRRYTQEAFRGQRMSKQLFAWMNLKFPKMDIRHSQNMTEAGRASV